MFQEVKMFTKRVLKVGMLSFELCSRTEEFTKAVQETCGKDGSKTIACLEQLKCQEREIIGCGTRLLQYIEESGPLQEPGSSSNELKSGISSLSDSTSAQADELSNAANFQDPSQLRDNILNGERHYINSCSDSGIDVTEEEKEDSMFRAQDKINSVMVTPGGAERLETVQALRETLRGLKRTTDKAVVEFLIRSRTVLQQEMKNQSDMDRDHKLLDLISDVLKHKQEADKQMKAIESSYHEENPLSVLEKSLCYVLVDKALLNCLLLLDKAHMEGKLTDCELELQYRKVGHKALSEFSQAVNENTQFTEMQQEMREKEEVIEKMRCQIRELSSDKARLENENKSLEEKSRWWILKSKELEMQNSAIDEERQLLKEKVCFLEESRGELESCTKHLRQQIRQRNKQNWLKGQHQNLPPEQEQQMEYSAVDHKETLKYAGDMSEVPSERLSDSDSREKTGKICSNNCKTGKEDNMNRKGHSGILNSAEVSEIQWTGIRKEGSNLSSGKDDKKESIETLRSKNEELRAKVRSLQTTDKELRTKMTTQTNAHDEILRKKNEELHLANEQSKAFEEDLDERLTEIVLLKAKVLELEKKSAIAKETVQKLRNELCLMKEGKDKTEVSNTMFRRKKERQQDELSSLLGQVKTYMNKDVDQSGNIGELCANVSSLRDEILCLNQGLEEKEETVQDLNERVRVSENKQQGMTVFLGDLVLRNQILVSKLEMIGAVKVVRNDFDVPDGYQEAVDGILRSQTSFVEKGVLAMVKAAEENENERKQLEEEQRRLKHTIETLETENILLKVQVNDLGQSVELLEDEMICMKHGVKSSSKEGRHPGTPKSGGSGGHRVTFGGDVGMEHREAECLKSLIEDAKARCVNLERQIRSNTSLLKVSQERNETLERDCGELRRRNSYLRRHLADCQQTTEILRTKVSELEDRLKAVGEDKSFDEMEKQSLEDRLKIMEGQTKYLKDDRENLKNCIRELLGDYTPSDETRLTAVRQSKRLETKVAVVEKDIDDVSGRKTDLEYEKECLKDKIKQQSARNRLLKCEIFEFLDDVRYLESELSCVVASVRSSDSDKGIRSIFCAGDTKIVSTWRGEASLCQEEGMTPIMAEILDLLKSVIQRLQCISRAMPVNGVDGNPVDAKFLSEQVKEEVANLRMEKRQIQREVFAVKAICEHLWDQTDSTDGASRAREEERGRALRKQILSNMERNSKMECEVLDHLRHHATLEDELVNLKNNILNLKVEKDVLSYLNDSSSTHCASKDSRKPYDQVTRNFCFVKREGNGFETQEVHGGVSSEHDNEDVLSSPSDEGVCHSPDQVSSCDSGYLSGRLDEGHSPVLNDKADPGHLDRHCPTGQPGRQYHGSFYDNIGKEQKRIDIASVSTAQKKPKGILKQSSGKDVKESSPSELRVAEDRNEINLPGCKVCNFSGLFKPFKRANQEHEDLKEYITTGKVQHVDH